jgi:GNAT superfamily N-acetyltransferase
MRDDINLRPVAAADIEFVYAVYASTRTEELAATGWNDAQKEQFLRMQFDAQQRHYQEHFPDASRQVIEWEGRAVGRLYVDRRPQEIGIIDITVLPAFRGRGIGKVLIQEILHAGAAGGLPVRIHVERFNPAMRLYERLGFRPIHDKGVYLQLEWTPATAGLVETAR